jgi:NADPH-dependent 2,4-dienoyl-CoA reductase/sulfur reductase-like enzyme
VVGAEHVSFSAALTLKESGTEVVALVTDLPRHQSFLQYKLISTDRFRIPVYTNWKVSGIFGQRRVEAVELTHTLDGSTRRVACDTVVFTGDWIPDYELAFAGRVEIDPNSHSPAVNQSLQTSTRGVFAAGNLIHAAETADIAALSGRYAARRVRDYLDTGAWPTQPAVPIQLDEALAWVSPSALVPSVGGVPRGRFVLRASRWVDRAVVEVWQGERCLWRKAGMRLVPNLPMYLPDAWLKQVQGEAPVRIVVHS